MSDNIFLEPEATFPVDIKREDGSFFLVPGGPYILRTATGREFASISQAFRAEDGPSMYGHLERHLVQGVPKESIGRMHPDVVYLMVAEVAKRSRMAEGDRGN